MTQTAEYYAQDIKEVWSFKQYDQYLKVLWSWYDLPFADEPANPHTSFAAPLTRPIENKSILEVGSAMGQAYFFLKNSGLIDLKNYTGLEVSSKGNQMSRERFPEANWVHADFTRYELKQRFDYVFERNAVHHMPEPVRQFEKMFAHTNRTVNISFRGCLEEGTISDLEVGRFVMKQDGRFFLNIISLPEVLRAGLKAGFNHIRVSYNGLHEPIPTDPKGDYYLQPDIARSKTIARFTLRLSHCPELNALQVYCIVPGKLGGLKLRLKEYRTYARVQDIVKNVVAVH
jgi:SAM-dependent methyltransferase